MHEVQIKTEALGFHCFAALSLQETTLNFFFSEHNLMMVYDDE